jgi:hypothetical protein
MLYAVNTRPGASLILARHASAIAFGEFVIYHVHGLFLVCVADALPPLPAALDDR